MWLLFGILAIVTMALNLIWFFRGRESKWFRFASLSLTALTLCAFYHQDAVYVLHQDWGALTDVTLPVWKPLWVLTMLSILFNGISLLPKSKKSAQHPLR